MANGVRRPAFILSVDPGFVWANYITEVPYWYLTSLFEAEVCVFRCVLLANVSDDCLNFTGRRGSRADAIGSRHGVLFTLHISHGTTS